MLLWAVRILAVCALALCGVLLFRRTGFFKTRLRKALYCLLALLLSAALLCFPFENWLKGFPTAESALWFSSPGMFSSSVRYVEGENSVFAISEDWEMGGVNIAIVGRTEQGWNGMRMSDMSPRKTAFTAQADVELYECRQTHEFYVLAAPVRGVELSLSDEMGTEFEFHCGVYVGYVGEMDGAYTLFINGDEVGL